MLHQGQWGEPGQLETTDWKAKIIPTGEQKSVKGTGKQNPPPIGVLDGQDWEADFWVP